MYQKIAVFILLYIISQYVNAQTIQLRSMVDKTEIEDVYVYTMNNRLLGVSNKEGILSIKINIDTLSTLKLYHINYINAEISAPQNDTIIYLIPKQNMLQEVVIVNKKELDELFYKALEKFSKQKSSNNLGEGYLSIVSITNGYAITEYLEGLYAVSINKNGIENWFLKEGRYAYKPITKTSIRSLNLSLLLKAATLSNKPNMYNIPLKPFITDSRTHKSIQIKKTSILLDDEVETVVFDYDCNIKNNFSYGTLVVDRRSMEIIKFKQVFSGWDNSILVSNNKNMTVEDVIIHYEFNFKDNLPVKIKTKVEYTVNSEYHIQSIMSFLLSSFIDSANLSCLTNSDNKGDYFDIFERIYKIEKWNNKPPIEPTQEVKTQIEQWNLSNHFENSITHQNDSMFEVQHGLLNLTKHSSYNILEVKNKASDLIHPDQNFIKKEGELIASLTGDLIIKWGCFDSKLEVHSIPYLNTNYTWIDSSELNNERLNMLYKYFNALVWIHAQKASLTLNNEYGLCEDLCKLDAKIISLKKNMQLTLNTMIKQCWGGYLTEQQKWALYWKRYINTELETLAKIGVHVPNSIYFH